MAPNEETSSSPCPWIINTNNPSPAKNDLAPPHFVSTVRLSSPARYELDCTKNGDPLSSIAAMSPGAPGASVTSPGPPRAVNVEMNADSPPAARLIAPNSPPFICDCSSILADIETIAPDSAWIDCSACSRRTASENDG